MSGIRTMFADEFNKFHDDCEKIMLDVSFKGEKYPPKIEIKGAEVWTQQEIEGFRQEERVQTQITVRGGVETAVSVKSLAMAKSDFTKIVGRAEKLLILWLHAFCEERMEEDKKT